VNVWPGQAGRFASPSRAGFVYVVEGTYELGINDQADEIYQAGETFTEPSGWPAPGSRANPSSSMSTRLIALSFIRAKREGHLSFRQSIDLHQFGSNRRRQIMSTITKQDGTQDLFQGLGTEGRAADCVSITAGR